MNKRDLEATFRINEKLNDGTESEYWMTGKEFGRHVDQVSPASFKPQPNASLRYLMKWLVYIKKLHSIETRRYYSHCIGYSPRTGTPRRHDRLANPIVEYGKKVTA